MKKSILFTSVILLMAIAHSCEKKAPPAELTPYEKIYASVSSPENEYFWEQFHKGNIENVKTIISRLEQQYESDSSNLLAAAHLGFANFWILSEGMRSAEPITDFPRHAAQAYRYFTRAYQLNPNDKRVLGFLADAEMAYAGVIQSQPMQQQGYLKGVESISAWPEFNKFTIGINFSGMPPQTDLFKAALEWQWTTLEDCYTSPIDRTNPNIQHLLNRDMSGHNLGKDRACYNSWIAPHNIEGFFLSMGDMITKAGDHVMAKKIYGLAKASPNYDTWAYKPVLEKRIQNAAQNVAKFLDPAQQGIDNVMIISSANLCMSCHKMSDGDLHQYRNFDWRKYFKEKDIYSVNGLK